MLNKA